MLAAGIKKHKKTVMVAHDGLVVDGDSFYLALTVATANATVPTKLTQKQRTNKGGQEGGGWLIKNISPVALATSPDAKIMSKTKNAIFFLELRGVAIVSPSLCPIFEMGDEKLLSEDISGMIILGQLLKERCRLHPLNNRYELKK